MNNKNKLRTFQSQNKKNEEYFDSNEISGRQEKGVVFHLKN